MKKIIITGANGFIGQNLVTYLSQFDYQIFALIRPNTFPEFKFNKKIHIFQGDITDSTVLSKIIQKNSIVINLAANPYHKTESYRTIVEGTKTLIKISKNKKIKKFIQLSSQATKIKNQGIYGKSKAIADQLLINSKVPYTILKPSLVYGPGEKGLFAKIDSYLNKSRIIPIFGTGEIKINPLYIDDLNIAIKKIIEDETSYSEIYEPGSNQFITYNKFYDLLTRHKNKTYYQLHIPTWIGTISTKILSIFFNNPPLTVDNILGSTQSSNPNPKKYISKYKHFPKSPEEGILTLTNPKKINIAVIGLGKMGILHSCIINTFNETKICAFIETNKSAYSTINTMGIKAPIFPNLNDALKNVPIDAVYITTPTFTHYNLLKEALKNNLHIFIEKPISLNLDQLNSLKKIKAKVVIHSGYTLLYQPLYQELSKIIKKKVYGKIKDFHVIFEHTENLNSKSWMFTKSKSGGGVLMNPGPHIFSLVNLFFGKPKKVESILKKITSQDVEDQAEISAYYPDFNGSIKLSWCSKNQPIPKTKITINFEKASIQTFDNYILIKKGKKSEKIYEKDLNCLEKNVFNINPESFGYCYYLETKNFIDSIKNSKKNIINSLNFAIQTEEIIQSVYLNSHYD